jgi:hypothetical protein
VTIIHNGELCTMKPQWSSLYKPSSKYSLVPVLYNLVLFKTGTTDLVLFLYSHVQFAVFVSCVQDFSLLDLLGPSVMCSVFLPLCLFPLTFFCHSLLLFKFDCNFILKKSLRAFLLLSSSSTIISLLL